MTHSNHPCSDAALRALLQSDDSRLNDFQLGDVQLGDSQPNGSGPDLRAAAAHVDGCPRCQLRLEELAGEPADWRAAHDALSPGDEPDLGWTRVAGAPPGASAWTALRPRQSPAWTESMARQLLAPPSHPEMLGRIGRYEVERIIGSGGMGVVFKAFDTELNRPVAVKVLAPHLASSGAARKRFSREARAAAAIVHEHVVAIHNVESDGAAPFLVMHYVAGESLQQRLDREGPLELCEVLRIATQTAAGLAAAHAQGLVHRDVKPSNILLEQGVERSLLTDFGLARASDDASLTHTGFHPGTPQYMSPEQARGDAVDARSDLFSLGSVLYTMAAGRPPFRAETTFGILRRITDAEPRPLREINPAIPDWFERLTAKLLSKSPADRFASATELHRVLEQCLAHVQQPQTTPLPESLRIRWRQAAALRTQAFLATPRGRWTLAASLAGLSALAASLMIPRSTRHDAASAASSPTDAGRTASRATPASPLDAASPGSSADPHDDAASRDAADSESEPWTTLDGPIDQAAFDIRRLERAANALWGDPTP